MYGGLLEFFGGMFRIHARDAAMHLEVVALALQQFGSTKAMDLHITKMHECVRFHVGLDSYNSSGTTLDDEIEAIRKIFVGLPTDQLNLGFAQMFNELKRLARKYHNWQTPKA
jgi:hypothetical protein